MTQDRSHSIWRVHIDVETLRKPIKDEYKEVAEALGKGFHLHTGRRLAKIVGCKDEWLEPPAGTPAARSVGNRESGPCPQLPAH